MQSDSTLATVLDVDRLFSPTSVADLNPLRQVVYVLQEYADDRGFADAFGANLATDASRRLQDLCAYLRSGSLDTAAIPQPLPNLLDNMARYSRNTAAACAELAKGLAATDLSQIPALRAEVGDLLAQASKETEEARLHPRQQRHRTRTSDAGTRRLSRSPSPPRAEGGDPDQEDGMKAGWRGRWWKYRQREECDEILSRKVGKWAEDDKRDAAAKLLIDALYVGFTTMRERASALTGLVQANSAARQQLLVLEQSGDAQLRSCLPEKTHLRESALRDLEHVAEALVALGEDDLTARKQRELSREKYVATVEDLTRRLKGLEDTYREQEQELASTEQEVLANPESRKAEILAEIERLEALIAERRRELEHLGTANTRAGGLRERLESLRPGIESLRSQLVALEEEEQGKQMSEASRSVQVSRVQQQYHSHRQLLDCTILHCEHYARCVDTERDVLRGFTSAWHQFNSQIAAFCLTETPRTLSTGVDLAAQLYELLQRLVDDKVERIVSIDSSITNHTMLLEFCVDTHDPNAHKHQTVLSELEAMRQTLVNDIDSHHCLQSLIVDHCCPLWRQLLQAAERPGGGQECADAQAAIELLRAQGLALVQAMESNDPSGVITRGRARSRSPPAPSPSLYVTGKRSSNALADLLNDGTSTSEPDPVTLNFSGEGDAEGTSPQRRRTLVSPITNRLRRLDKQRICAGPLNFDPRQFVIWQ
eukprot:TRINITY_DN8276_c0_g1_i1.p1 TRINITY_DN8276_c0_g1~~TRINITY_DN8276_c0_g1_i1.p1  ORF type:complete len:713 (-),score=110.88 TRINITY_DN8276_c0_g1_i1:13-2151(-)